MEEADRLCDRLAIIDNGRMVVEGAPKALKRGVGADHVRVTLSAESLARAGVIDGAARAVIGIEGVTGVEPGVDGLSVSSADGHRAIPAILRRLDATGFVVDGLALREPTLDDVFLRHCGRHIRAEVADQPVGGGWM
jgi:ABC-2 type transport system ATP-binding protein